MKREKTDTNKSLNYGLVTFCYVALYNLYKC